MLTATSSPAMTATSKQRNKFCNRTIGLAWTKIFSCTFKSATSANFKSLLGRRSADVAAPAVLRSQLDEQDIEEKEKEIDESFLRTLKEFHYIKDTLNETISACLSEKLVEK
jgi:hypothetical protein